MDDLKAEKIRTMSLIFVIGVCVGLLPSLLFKTSGKTLLNEQLTTTSLNSILSGEPEKIDSAMEWLMTSLTKPEHDRVKSTVNGIVRKRIRGFWLGLSNPQLRANLLNNIFNMVGYSQDALTANMARNYLTWMQNSDTEKLKAFAKTPPANATKEFVKKIETAKEDFLAKKCREAQTGFETARKLEPGAEGEIADSGLRLAVFCQATIAREANPSVEKQNLNRLSAHRSQNNGRG